MFNRAVSVVILVLGALMAWPAWAQGTVAPAESFYPDAAKALSFLFMLAVLLESALSVIFNWRLYLVLANGKGFKTLVMIAVSCAVVWQFHVDTVSQLLKLYGGTAPSDTLSRLLTALILAGGSAGVNQVLVNLGYRQAKSPEELRPKPKANKAWISVVTSPRHADGPIYVRISQAGPITDTSPARLAGVIAPVGILATIRSVFLANRHRFPPSGGHEIEADRQYRIEVTARDAAGGLIASDINGLYTFADGAIIDFSTTL